MSKESFQSGLSTAARNIAETAGRVVDDPKLQKSMGKTATRAMVASGVMRKTPILRRNKFDAAGAAKAIANPSEAGLLAANQLRKDLPRIAFHLGTASVRAVFEQRRENREMQRFAAMQEASAGPSEASANAGAEVSPDLSAMPDLAVVPDLSAIREQAAGAAMTSAELSAHPELAAAGQPQQPDSHEYPLAA